MMKCRLQFKKPNKKIVIWIWDVGKLMHTDTKLPSECDIERILKKNFTVEFFMSVFMLFFMFLCMFTSDIFAFKANCKGWILMNGYLVTFRKEDN